MSSQAFFSKKKTTTKDEGLSYKNHFGKDSFREFTEFAHVEFQTMVFEVELLIYYRITDDDYFQFMQILVEDENVFAAREKAKTEKGIIDSQFRYNYDCIFKENLLQITEKIFQERIFFEGLPIWLKSDYISEDEFQQIKTNINKKKKFIAKDSPLLNFMKKNGLHPRAYDNKNGLYVSSCVNSSAHQLYISIQSDYEEWGCGYCGKKGGIPELQNWLNEKKQKTK